MEHIGTQVIETERLLLRKFTLDDTMPMFNNWASSNEVTKHLTWQTHESPTVTASIVEKWVESYQDAAYYHWVIVLKETNEPIGSISLHNVKEFSLSCEVGYCIGDRYWGQGLMPEALKAVIKFCIYKAGFNRVCAKHSIHNPKSGRVMQKAHMQYEGKLRQAYRVQNGDFVDCFLYAIIKDDLDNNVYF